MPPPESLFAIDSPRIAALSEVPEDSVVTPRSPYFHAALSSSTSTFKAATATTSSSSLSSASGTSSSRGVAGPRSPSHLVRPSPSRSTSEVRESVASAVTGGSGRGTPAAGGSRTRSGSPATLKEKQREREGDRESVREKHRDRGKERSAKSSKSSGSTQSGPRMRTTPHLPHAKDVEVAPPTLMYWSPAPVFGLLPQHGMRAHSATLVDSVVWLFGGCDEKGCWKDVYLFNTETMQWMQPVMLGDVPPPCRAHTATLVDRRMVVFGGGEGPVYYNDTFVLDTATRRWTRVVFPEGAPVPPPRRAHTAVLYKNKVWVFGGGNGMEALNDVWTLDVSGPVERMRWQLVDTRGKKPIPRGYHTANLVGNVMVVVGGSDGRECFADIWCLNLDSLVWSQVTLDVSYRRLSHTATQVGSYLFIMGGHDGSQYTSELLLFNLVALNYEPRSTAGKPPLPRGYHVAFLADSRLFLIGGFNGSDVYDDVHILDLAGAAYLPQVTSFTIDVE